MTFVIVINGWKDTARSLCHRTVTSWQMWNGAAERVENHWAKTYRSACCLCYTKRSYTGKWKVRSFASYPQKDKPEKSKCNKNERFESLKWISRMRGYEPVPKTTTSWYGPAGGIRAKMQYKNRMYCHPSENPSYGRELGEKPFRLTVLGVGR